MKTTIKLCTHCMSSYDAGAVHICDEMASGVVAAPPILQPHAGMLIDKKYELLNKLGEGGMGSVFRARRKYMDDVVAIKFIRPEVVADSHIRKRFCQEAQVAALIKHPNAVAVYDFGETIDGLVYLVMEYLEGLSLGQLIAKSGPLNLEQVIEIGVQICDALTCMLENNVIHRDLKPDNIMLVQDSGGAATVKVVDFGVAKFLESNSKLTRVRARLGSPVYSSPEQCLGQGVDHRTDIYALGVIFYECLTGRLPFEAQTEGELFSAILHQKPPRLDIGSGLAETKMAELVWRLLAKRPADRPQDAAEVRHSLQSLDVPIVKSRQAGKDDRTSMMGQNTLNHLISASAHEQGQRHARLRRRIREQPEPGLEIPLAEPWAKMKDRKRKKENAAKMAIVFVGLTILSAALAWEINRIPQAKAYVSESWRNVALLSQPILTKALQTLQSLKSVLPRASGEQKSERIDSAEIDLESLGSGLPPRLPESGETPLASRNRTQEAQKERPQSAPTPSKPALFRDQKIIQPPATVERISAATNQKRPRPVLTPARFRESEMARATTMPQIPPGMVLLGETVFRQVSEPATDNWVWVDNFLISRHEVTNSEYLAFVRETGQHAPEWLEPGSKYHYQTGRDDFYQQLGEALQAPDHPVVGVSWYDAVKYCEWLSQKSDYEYRLPTAAEWELAARGGKREVEFSWGNGAPTTTNGGNIADVSLKKLFPNLPAIWRDYDDRYLFTAPVGSFGANLVGLYDMTGNVWEWCGDTFEEQGESNQSGATLQKVIRGGSWSDTPDKLRLAYRRGLEPTFRSNNLGFRVAATMPKSKL